MLLPYPHLLSRINIVDIRCTSLLIDHFHLTCLVSDSDEDVPFRHVAGSRLTWFWLWAPPFPPPTWISWTLYSAILMPPSPMPISNWHPLQHLPSTVQRPPIAVQLSRTFFVFGVLNGLVDRIKVTTDRQVLKLEVWNRAIRQLKMWKDQYQPLLAFSQRRSSSDFIGYCICFRFSKNNSTRSGSCSGWRGGGFANKTGLRRARLRRTMIPFRKFGW